MSKKPNDPKVLVCKRVKAVYGDTVRTGYFSTLTIPRGHVWLEGDNTQHSIDSREYGPIPMGLVIGRVIMKVLNKLEINCVQTNDKCFFHLCRSAKTAFRG